MDANTWLEELIQQREADRLRREEDALTSDPAEMFRFIRRFLDQKTPRRENDLDRQFKRLTGDNPTFAAYWRTYRDYWGDLKYWCRCVQEGERPARPEGVPQSFEDEIVAYYERLYR